MSRRAPRPMSIAFERVAAGLAPQTALAVVQAAWEEAAGPGVAAHGTPVRVRNGTVTVYCPEAVWAGELQLLGPTLVQRLNAVAGEPVATEIRCTARPPREV